MPPMSPPNQAVEDPSAGVAKTAASALQSLALLFDEVNQIAPDSPIAGAVQDLMKATSEVKRHITQVGPDLQEGTEDDATGDVDTPAEPGMEEAPPEDAGMGGEMPAEMEDPNMGAPVDPGPMGPGPMNAAGRGMNQALLDAAKRKQP